MKLRPSLTIVVLTAFLATSVPLHARQSDPYANYAPDAMAIDALVARPLGLAATLIGTGLFIATLPITIISGSTHKAARSLVATPANLTFKRKLGNLSALED